LRQTLMDANRKRQKLRQTLMDANRMRQKLRQTLMDANRNRQKCVSHLRNVSTTFKSIVRPSQNSQSDKHFVITDN
jgi:hypothetical protein